MVCGAGRIAELFSNASACPEANGNNALEVSALMALAFDWRW